MKLAQLIDINMNNIFRKYLAWFGKLCPKSGPFITLPTYQISQNQLWWVCGFLFWWMYAFGQSKKTANIIYSTNNYLFQLYYHFIKIIKAVCNFQSMKTPKELNSLLSKFFFLYHLVLYITWLDATMDDLQARPLRQILLFLWNNRLTV